MSLNFAALYKGLRRVIGPGGTLRVAVFFPVDPDNKLRVDISYDGHNFDCITTPNSIHAARFALARPTSKCLAVAASLEGGLHVIPNTHKLKGPDKRKFMFFDNKQKTIIRSMIAYGYNTNDTGPYPVITADSDRRLAFHADDLFCKILTIELREFANRLFFEADVHKLLT